MDEEPYILYRRHGDAVTSSGSGVKKRIKNELKIYWNSDDKRRKIAYFLLKTLSDTQITPEAKKVLRYIYGYKKHLRFRIRLVFSGDLTTNIGVVDLKNKMAVLTGRY